jgi:UDP-N-acetylmuramoylalanine--D-glutamate ligase
MMKKNIGILGLGKSGVAAANLAIKLGYNVFASDSGSEIQIKNLNKKVITEFGEHSDKILNSDIIIKSPGIHPDTSILTKARKHKIKIISELTFSLIHSKYKKIIAVTGTNGKTTTTDLLSKIIKVGYEDSIVSGNIGLPLADKALKTTKNTYIIMELSSYQLEDTPDFKPDISILLNITHEHIEHHKTIKAYLSAKKNVFINQTSRNFTIANYDNKICKQITDKTNGNLIFFSKKFLKNGVFYDKNNGKIIIKIGGKYDEIRPKINMLGCHNIENILAAVTASYTAGIKSGIIEKVISEYTSIEHRIEFIKTLNGVDYYNDSKSTNIDSTKVAIKSFAGNILLIMGGYDKGFPYTPLKRLVKQKVRSIFLIGEAANKIKRDLCGIVKFIDCGTIENAVNKIFRTATTGNIVLFSPGCASFDQFRDFEERGKIFKQLVNKL